MVERKTDNAVNEAITASLNDRGTGDTGKDVNNFPAAIQEIGEALFERYPEKTGILSNENILGMIRCKALNDYIQETTGVRYTVLDSIVAQTESRRLSAQGKGLQLFIDAIHGIQASFEQIAPGLLDRMRR
jgi:hypothetical protein